jgi:hypothetical protein
MKGRTTSHREDSSGKPEDSGGNTESEEARVSLEKQIYPEDSDGNY